MEAAPFPTTVICPFWSTVTTLSSLLDHSKPCRTAWVMISSEEVTETCTR